MRKLFSLLVLLYNVLSPNHDAIIPFLKGAYVPFLKEPFTAYKGLSPVMGAVAWYSGWIAGLHKWGAPRIEKIRASDGFKFMVLAPSADATVSLVDELFQNVNNDIIPTHTNHPLYLLIKNDDADGTLLNKFLSLVKSDGFSTASPARTALITELATVVAQKLIEKPGATEIDDAEEKDRAAKGAAERKKLQRSFNVFFNHIGQSLAECGVDKRYPEQTTQQIIAAYWYAVQLRSEMRAAGVPLKEHMQQALERYMHALDVSDFRVQEYDASQIERMLFHEDVVREEDAESEFGVDEDLVVDDEAVVLSPASSQAMVDEAAGSSLSIEITPQEDPDVLDIEALSPITPRSPDATSDISISFTPLDDDALEQMLVGAVLYAASSERYPAVALMGSFGYQGKAPVSNCVETTLHNFFNLLLFDKATQQYTLELLPSALQISDRLRVFYRNAENMLAKNTNLDSVRQAWMDTVSGLPEIEYVHGDYEIRSKPNNVLRVINTLLGTTASSFEELGTLLSTSARTIVLTTRSTDDGFICAISRDDETITATVHIDQGHAHVQFPQKFIDDCDWGNWHEYDLHPYELMQAHLFFADDCFSDDEVLLTPQQWSFLSYSSGASNIERLLFFTTHAVSAACKNADDICLSQIDRFVELFRCMPFDQLDIQKILVKQAFAKNVFERLPAEIHDRIMHLTNIDDYIVQFARKETIGAFADKLDLVTKGRQYWDAARKELNADAMIYLEEHGIKVPMPTRLRFAAYRDQFSYDGDESTRYFNWLLQSDRDAVRKAFVYALKAPVIAQLIRNAGDSFEFDLLHEFSEERLLQVARRLMHEEIFKNWFERNHLNLIGRFDSSEYDIDEAYEALDGEKREELLLHVSQEQKDDLLRFFIIKGSPEALVLLQHGAQVDDDVSDDLPRFVRELDAEQRKQFFSYLSVDQKNALLLRLLKPWGYGIVFELMEQGAVLPEDKRLVLPRFYTSLSPERQQLVWNYLLPDQKDSLLKFFLKIGSAKALVALQYGARLHGISKFSLQRLYTKLNQNQQKFLFSRLNSEQRKWVLSKVGVS